MVYPIIKIPDDREPESSEQQGARTKYWFNQKQDLFKIGRVNTGENWAEKVASELCELMGLPHAHYDFAIWKNDKGVISKQFVPSNARLVTANGLLAEIHKSYPQEGKYKVRDYTIRRIIALFNKADYKLPMNWDIPSHDIKSAADVFLGYLLLDAWIANQERHHENWGVVYFDKQIYLAPTYDHAASMAQNESDARRRELLTTRDNNRHISQYIIKARSAIYSKKSETKPMLTLDVFQHLALKRPVAARFWLQRLNDISMPQCQAIFNQIPETEISELAIECAIELLERNKSRLLQVEL